MLLAVDPSVRSPGAALFYQNRLIAAGRVRCADKVDSAGAYWLASASSILTWARNHGAYSIDVVDAIIFERPQIYRASKSKGDPNDLIGLAGVGMAVVAMCHAEYPGVVIDTPTPAEWIGQLPKSTKGSAKASPRALRILSRLDPAESLIVPDQHDAIDACGLGLHHLGRLAPRRVFSNGRDGR